MILEEFSCQLPVHFNHTLALRAGETDPFHQEWFREIPPYLDLVQIPPHLWLPNPAALLFWIASLFVSHAGLGSQVTSLHKILLLADQPGLHTQAQSSIE